MRLLLTTDAIGGVWDYTATLARELESRGQAILLAVIGKPTPEQLAQLPEGVALDCRDDRLEWMPGATADLGRTAAWIERLGRSWGAQLVHLNQLTYTGAASFNVPTVVVVHSDVASWFTEVTGASPAAEWEPYIRAVTKGIARATTVVAPTRYQASLTWRQYGRAADRVIYNAATPPPSRPLDGRGPLVLLAGRAWDAAKGAGILEDALEILGDDAPPATLLGSLEGPSGERFEPVRIGYHGRVTADEVHDWMSRASIYCAPSLYEPFGLAPLEAALHECALVLSDIGSFRELWNGCAEFFSKGSASDLARAIDRVRSDEVGARRIGKSARARALELYGADRFAAEYLALYEALTGRGSGERLAENVSLSPTSPTDPA